MPEIMKEMGKLWHASQEKEESINGKRAARVAKGSKE
jgi:hypothetical protein